MLRPAAAIAAMIASGLVACALVTDLNASDYKVQATACTSVGTGSGQLTSGSTSCDACLATQCCSAAATCFAPSADGGLSDCALIESCLSKCATADAGSGECQSECLGAHFGGLEGIVEISTCATSSCASAGCSGF